MPRKHPFDVLASAALDAAKLADSATHTANLGLGAEALARASGLPDLGGIRGAESITNRIGTGVRVGDLFQKFVVPSIDDELIGSWRKGLAGFEQPLISSISEDIARRVSDLHVSGALNPLTALVESTMRPSSKFMEQLQEQLVGIRTAALAALENVVRPAAFLASGDFAERMQAWDEEQQRNAEALRKLDWWVPVSIPMRAYMEIGRLAYQRKRMPLRHAMVSLSHSTMFREVVEDQWMDIPVFRERRRWFREALAEHRRGRYHLSILLLLPHLEGIPFAAFAPGSQKTNPEHALQQAGVDYTGIASDGLLDAMTVLYRFSSFADTARRPNRHWILHGRDLRYGTAANSARVLFAFDLVAHVIKRAGSDKGAMKAENDAPAATGGAGNQQARDAGSGMRRTSRRDSAGLECAESGTDDDPEVRISHASGLSRWEGSAR